VLAQNNQPDSEGESPSDDLDFSLDR